MQRGRASSIHPATAVVLRRPFCKRAPARNPAILPALATLHARGHHRRDALDVRRTELRMRSTGGCRRTGEQQPAGLRVQPERVAGGQRACRFMQPAAALSRGTGRELGPERLDLGPQPVAPAAVVADQVQDSEPAPELPAMGELVHDGGVIRRVVFADHDEGPDAKPHQPSRHPSQRNDRHRQDLPDSLQVDLHGLERCLILLG